MKNKDNFKRPPNLRQPKPCPFYCIAATTLSYPTRSRTAESPATMPMKQYSTMHSPPMPHAPYPLRNGLHLLCHIVHLPQQVLAHRQRQRVGCVSCHLCDSVHGSLFQFHIRYLFVVDNFVIVQSLVDSLEQHGRVGTRRQRSAVLDAVFKEAFGCVIVFIAGTWWRHFL